LRPAPCRCPVCSLPRSCATALSHLLNLTNELTTNLSVRRCTRRDSVTARAAGRHATLWTYHVLRVNAFVFQGLLPGKEHSAGPTIAVRTLDTAFDTRSTAVANTSLSRTRACGGGRGGGMLLRLLLLSLLSSSLLLSAFTLPCSSGVVVVVVVAPGD
jgi:hypothetical protein